MRLNIQIIDGTTQSLRQLQQPFHSQLLFLFHHLLQKPNRLNHPKFHHFHRNKPTFLLITKHSFLNLILHGSGWLLFADGCQDFTHEWHVADIGVWEDEVQEGKVVRVWTQVLEVEGREMIGVLWCVARTEGVLELRHLHQVGRELHLEGGSELI